MDPVSPTNYYDRQLRVPGWGAEGQAVLGRSTVLVVGVGGLGCPALVALARAGVGRLVLVDGDRVEVSNLSRQILFDLADVGRPKVEAAAEALGRANPWIRIETHPFRLDRSNVRALVEAADLVVEGSDNFATKFLVHDACRSGGKPLVLASLYQWEAQVSVFPFHKPGPGCWRCLYPEAPEDGCVGVCADVGVAGALAGMAGSAQALAAIRILLDLEGIPSLATWVFDASEWTPRLVRWKVDPHCFCQGGPGDWSWLEVPVPGSLPEIPWPETPADRLVVVDIREDVEIRPGEWAWFEAQGSRVVHFPWSKWPGVTPVWELASTYLIVCARGRRSLAAMETISPEIHARSLAAGVLGLGLSQEL